MYVEGAAQFASTPELSAGEPLRELLAAIEEKSKLVALLNGCIEAPEPVHIQIGVKEINVAGEHLSLITAPYPVRDQGQGSLGVLGPMRMEYERAITAVVYVARAFSEMREQAARPLRKNFTEARRRRHDRTQIQRAKRKQNRSPRNWIFERNEADARSRRRLAATNPAMQEDPPETHRCPVGRGIGAPAEPRKTS